jgi:hypothetical protein
MPSEIKLNGPSMEQRIANRLKNSGEGAKPDASVQQGSSAQRVFHNIHHSGSVGGTNLSKDRDPKEGR